MVPPKDYEPLPDLAPTLKRYAKLFDLRAIGQQLGYPLFMKPYDGGGWRAVSRCADESQLKARYEESGKSVMHLQAAVHPFDSFVRCIGLGPQTHLVKYDPDAALHDRYTQATDFVSGRRGRDPARHDADDQRVLRLGLQLVRGAAQGRRLVPDRLRQPVPRLAGDVACTATSRGW
jgi:hypothetical protein